jgi:hypothetical protein
MKILSKPVEILLVEDNDGDVGLIEEFSKRRKSGIFFMSQKMEKKQFYFYTVKRSFQVPHARI